MAVIPFARVLDYERLPIDAQDVVTRARVVVAGQATKERLASLYNWFHAVPNPVRRVPYYPMPIGIEYADPNHTFLEAERSFELPAGVDPFLPATHASIPNPTAVRFSNPNLVRDGDPSTFAERTGTVDSSLTFSFLGQGPLVAGFRVVYSLTSTPPTVALSTPPVYVRIAHRRIDAFSRSLESSAVYELTPSADPTEFRAVLPPTYSSELRQGGFGWASQTVTLYVNPDADVTNLRVYELVPLLLDGALLTGIAKAQIRVPASHPRRVTVAGYLPPGDASHMITGWPGGDYTGPVARQTYRAGTTIVDFEQTAAPPGVPQELVEAERVRVNRTREAIQTANYPTLVGNHFR